MAGAAGGDEATVSKEMAGNSFAVSSGRCHRASTAQRGRESRRVSCVRPGILDGERGAGLVRRLVVREHWSPGRIAGGIAVERPGLMVFASAIHRAINERRLDPPGLTRARRGIRARLRHKGKRRHGRGGPEERRGEIPGARPIGQRPEIVGERSGLGDREGDAVVGKGAGRASSRSWTAEAVCSPEDAVPRMPDATLPMWGSARSEGIRGAGP
ncbi:Transposase [Bifidobacterium longum subsp. longum]|nr:Transposase [Bifidobacterium longum subsp. longum]TCE54555.1 Transposase [Bifidobacterium longum subsp. longum]